MVVQQHLDFDVTRALDEPFDVQRSVTEGRDGLASCLRDRIRQLGLVAHGLHADAAAAFRRLDEHREPDPPGCVGDRRVALVGRRLARNDGNAGLGRDLDGRQSSIRAVAITSGGGPTKVTPAAAHAAAKS